VSSVPRHRRRRKIRRTGQHTAPSQVEKVAQTAGKAAPAVVVVGTIATAAPQIHGSAPAKPAVTATHSVPARLDAATLPAHPANRGDATRSGVGHSYTVRAGDTLSGIAQRFYGSADDWHGLFAANHAEISDPSLIYVGQQLRLPRHLPAGISTTAYTPRHASSAAAGSSAAGSSGGASSTGASDTSQAATTTSLSGTLSCTGLEQLWLDAGGSPAAEVTAASIAMAESGGNQFATGTVGERGYWQINPVNGALSTYDPYGNARAAVVMSADGTNWSPWTTFTSGAYLGRC
jgi:LysM repeat protein